MSEKALKNKIAVITGAAGEIGQTIALRYLQEGAITILTGRTYSKLELMSQKLIAENPDFAERIFIFAMDNSNPVQVINVVADIIKQFKHIDILINNAGSAGPKQKIAAVPLTNQELQEDTETAWDAIGSLLMGPWLVTKAFAPYFNTNASIINVSTIFSKEAYFGRVAYVVPKAALNELSLQMAVEFGKDARNIRVNTIYPGPVDSDRIQNVFKSMDKLQNLPIGATYKHYTAKMTMCNEPLLISKMNIADTMVFLGSEASAGFTGHDFEVTHGMQSSEATTIDLITLPNLSNLDLESKKVLIIGGETAHAKDVAKNLSVAESTIYYDKMPNDLAPDMCLIFVAARIKNYGDSVLELEDNQIAYFCKNELLRTLEIAKTIEQGYKVQSPLVIFVSCEPQNYNVFAKILSAAIEELIRVWRKERQYDKDNNLITHTGAIYQLITYRDISGEHAIHAAQHISWLTLNSNQPSAINLVLSEDIQKISRAKDLTFSGLHAHKVALVTGGSEGIGAEIVRLLLLSGAKVVAAARDAQKLEALQHKVLHELQEAGFDVPYSRILTIANSDIGSAATPSQLIKETINAFGRIDYLINNAGIAGAEEMVVDMPLDTWTRTLKANLISNYELMLLSYPLMRDQQHGHILNMSSHFGGVRHTTVVYPNRADYALSKTGQRLLAETLAEFLGPEIQINAIAPGPVEGARISGAAGREGLYQKRSRLILENKRLQLVYVWLLSQVENSKIPASLLYNLAKNKISDLQKIEQYTSLISQLDRTVNASSAEYILNQPLADKLLQRLELGMFIETEFSIEKFFQEFNAPPSNVDFLASSQINTGIEKIRDKMLSALALKRMPSNYDVAREVVYYLSNNNVTGETLYPSCGLKFDDYVTETEWVPSHNSHKFNFNNEIIYIFGNAMLQEMSEAINSLALTAKKIIVVTLEDSFARLLKEKIAKSDKVVFEPLDGNTLTAALSKLPQKVNELIKEYSSTPDVILSFPFGALYEAVKDDLPSVSTFEALINQHITNNFAVLQRATLIDGCKVILITEGVKHNNQVKPVSIMLLDFLKNTLRTLTATAAKEAQLLPHRPYFYQIEPNGSSEVLLGAILELATSENQQPYHSGMIFKICG